MLGQRGCYEPAGLGKGTGKHVHTCTPWYVHIAYIQVYIIHIYIYVYIGRHINTRTVCTLCFSRGHIQQILPPISGTHFRAEQKHQPSKRGGGTSLETLRRARHRPSLTSAPGNRKTAGGFSRELLCHVTMKAGTPADILVCFFLRYTEDVRLGTPERISACK